MVNEMIDLVESGLDQSEEQRMGRVVMLSVTLSLTTENTETATVTTTLVNSCVAGTFTECTTSTEAASSRCVKGRFRKTRAYLFSGRWTTTTRREENFSRMLL